jgi:hypothetical protein
MDVSDRPQPSGQGNADDPPSADPKICLRRTRPPTNRVVVSSPFPGQKLPAGRLRGARTRWEALPDPLGRGRPVGFSSTGLRIFFEIPVPECPRRAYLKVSAVRRDG